MQNFCLDTERTGLMLIDVQEKLWPLVDRAELVLHTMEKAIKGFRILDLPIVVTEQYPQGLGSTVEKLRQCLPDNQQYLAKTHFSGLGDPAIKEQVLAMPVEHWVLIGIEAHVCILQTAKDLLREERQVIIVNDAISSRSLFDFSTAIGELRDVGARISCTETILFELLGDSRVPQFREMSALIK